MSGCPTSELARPQSDPTLTSLLLMMPATKTGPFIEFGATMKDPSGLQLREDDTVSLDMRENPHVKTHAGRVPLLFGASSKASSMLFSSPQSVVRQIFIELSSD